MSETVPDGAAPDEGAVPDAGAAPVESGEPSGPAEGSADEYVAQEEPLVESSPVESSPIDEVQTPAEIFDAPADLPPEPDEGAHLAAAEPEPVEPAPVAPDGVGADAASDAVALEGVPEAPAEPAAAAQPEEAPQHPAAAGSLTAEAEAEGESSTAGGIPGWIPAVLGALAALLLLVVLVLGALRLFGVNQGTSKADDNRDAAVAAARQAVVNVTSFDYHDLTGQLKRVEQTSGGTFAKELANTKTALVQEVTTQQRVSSSQVVEAAVANASDTEVTVLLAVDELRKTKATPKGVTLRYRMQVRMSKKGGHWLLIELRPVT
ncbi:MAG: Mce-associated rane protein [Frankiales bacterium]|jgi:Mce-associated membrane protein|nr:Mce-associated rane protein [Frankiales bacterium]